MDDEKKLKELLKKIFLIGCKGGMAHLASCYSCLEILYVLYVRGVLKLDAANPKWSGRDRFILSKGHAGLALYCIMAQAGLLSEEACASYMQPGGGLGGEPCMRDSCWVEATTGSLGHGLSFAQGMAMALKADGNPAMVYVLLGDGELNEGSVWEAFMSAAHYGLENLTAVIDRNRLSYDGDTETVMGLECLNAKLSSFGWHVSQCDGHDIWALLEAFQDTKAGRPHAILAETVKGKGVSFAEHRPEWHHHRLSQEEYDRARKEVLGETL